MNNKNFFNFDVLTLSENFEIFNEGEKTIYNTDGLVSASDWVKLKNKFVDCPQMSNALKVKSKGKGKWCEDALGYIINNSNNVYYNGTLCGLFTSGFGGNNIGQPFTKENFYKNLVFFTARRTVNSNWINQKDEYLVPDESHESFNQYKYDSIIYSLFNSASNQSSLRQIDYKDKLWDIKNEFFWMSVDKMKELADQNGYDELYNDARTASDRYVYKLLFGEDRIYDRLSPDAKAVLDKATELVERSIELRQVMANDENHLNSWDAGYAQLKLVWKEYFQEDFKEFRQLYKNLEGRMRPLVYELGFLKK